MGFRATGETSKATATVIASALQALVVAPVVSSVVLMFVTVGFAAVAIGAFSTLAGYPAGRTAGERRVSSAAESAGKQVSRSQLRG